METKDKDIKVVLNTISAIGVSLVFIFGAMYFLIDAKVTPIEDKITELKAGQAELGKRIDGLEISIKELKTLILNSKTKIAKKPHELK